MSANKQTAALRPNDIKRLRVLAALNGLSMMDTVTVLINQFEKEHGVKLDSEQVEKVAGVK